MSKISIQLVTFNGARYLPPLFASLRAQTFTDWELLIVDNSSTDDTVAVIKKELAAISRPWRLIEKKINTGFAGGHNQLFGDQIAQGEGKTTSKLQADYILLLNQDLSLAPRCLESLVAVLDTRPDAAAVAPRLMKWDFTNHIFTDTIDSLGLGVLRNRRALEIDAGKKLTKTGHGDGVENSFNRTPLADESAITEVFGVSGALPLYRRAALERVALTPGQIFDESYHSYKEDVDLAWRLRIAGYKCYCVTSAVAYHDRTGFQPRRTDDRFQAANKKKQSAYLRYHSYKNHLMTLYKNEYVQNLLLDFPWILWYEGKKLIYFLLFDRATLAGLKEIWLQRRDLKIKRQSIKKMRVASWSELRQWWA